MGILFDIYDTNSETISLTGDERVLIRYFSDAKIIVDVDSAGSVIDLDTCIIKNGSETGYGTEHTFVGVTSDKFKFSAQDINGNSVSHSETVDIVEYIKLTCNPSSNKPDTSGNMTVSCNGKCFDGSFGRSSNTLTVSYRWRVIGRTWSSYSSMTVKKSGSIYTATANLSGLNYKLNYDFEFVASDALMTVNTSSLNVSSLPVFHWGKNDVVFEVPATFNGGISIPESVTKTVTFGGGVKIKNSLYLQEGSLYFGNDTSCQISGDANGLEMNAPGIEMSADTIELWADSLEYNGNPISFPESGAWIPSLTASGSYRDRIGWYTKIGNMVTVGFLIRADTDEAYDGEDICIEGLPYYPAYSAAGGGMCSKATMAANMNFQCFVAEIDGTITTRGQACDETDGDTLSTSAIACLYNSLERLTLSGTIMYMTD